MLPSKPTAREYASNKGQQGVETADSNESRGMAAYGAKQGVSAVRPQDRAVSARHGRDRGRGRWSG
jgi:hypothetical protein